AAQAERIDPARMPMTRIVNAAIDGVAQAFAAVAGEIGRFAGADLICYRAHYPASLVGRQQEAWDPLLAWPATRLGPRLRATSDLVFTPQAPEALEAIARDLATCDAVSLAAIHTITTLTGSAVLALAVARGRLEPEAAWAAAHVDEDFQTERWG